MWFLKKKKNLAKKKLKVEQGDSQLARGEQSKKSNARSDKKVRESRPVRYAKMLDKLSGYENKDTGEVLKRHLKFALDNFNREDRGIWYLKKVQQYYLLFNPCEDRDQASYKKERKRLQKVDPSHVRAEYERLTQSFELEYPHYHNFATTNYAKRMAELAFYTKGANGQMDAKSVSDVLAELQAEEQKVISHGKQLYCNDGEPIIVVDDEWTWFRIESGISRQEARAMRHCGNVHNEGMGFVMYSLRKKVVKMRARSLETLSYLYGDG